MPFKKGKLNYSVVHGTWNKGLTKETDKRLKKISKDRIGQGNPNWKPFRKCLICGKDFKGRINQKYCSYECMGFSRKRELNPNWGKFKNPVIQCVVCKKEFRTRKDKGQECCSLKCRNKFIKGRKRTLESRIKQGKTRTGKYRGKNNPSWKGGVQRGKPKGDWRYYKWYKAVFKRDNFTCISCGERGVYLEAHHIKNWRYNPKLRYKVKNGLTLCKSCHNPTKGLEVEFEPYFEEIIKIVYGGLK